MLKLSSLVLLILIFVPALFIPVAYASGAQPEAAAQAPVNHNDISPMIDQDDAGASFGTGISAQALGTAAPIKQSVTLTDVVYDAYGTKYWSILVPYEAPSTGFYTFCSLGGEDTDIELYDSSDNYLDGDKTPYTPFSLWLYMEAGKQYYIRFSNHGKFDDYGFTGYISKSVCYLVTLPKALGSGAVVMGSGGYSITWLQGFDFNIPAAGLYTFNISCASSCLYYISIWKGSGYGDLTSFGTYGPYTKDAFETLDFPGAGSYHACVWMHNNTSSAYTYTIAIDNGIQASPGMSGGVVRSRELAADAFGADDILTADYFIPEVTGAYMVQSNRSNARISVYDATGRNMVLFKSTAAKAVMNAGHTYYIYFVTNGTNVSRRFTSIVFTLSS